MEEVIGSTPIFSTKSVQKTDFSHFTPSHSLSRWSAFPLCNNVAKKTGDAYLSNMFSKRALIDFKKHLAKGLTLLLLVLYAIGSLQIESFHRLLHAHDEAALHSPEQEENDCHRLVFHNQSKGDCKHKSHVTELKKCPLCQITVQQDQLAHTICGPCTPSVENQSIILAAEVLVCETRLHLPSRAPPTVA
jgi:cell division protein FtsL